MRRARAQRDVGKTHSRRLAKLETILGLAYQVKKSERFGRISKGGSKEVLLDALIDFDPYFLERYIQSNEELAHANRRKRVILLDRKRLVEAYRRRHPLVEAMASREINQWVHDRSWKRAIDVYYTRNGSWGD